MRDILGERDEVVPDMTTRVAEPSRESQLPKKFYKDVSVSSVDDGWQIELDGRRFKPPFIWQDHAHERCSPS